MLGVDLGTEYIKAALVKPGIPLEIVLTKDSKRKEASAVTFKPSKSGPQSGSFPERFYGGDALALAARFPGDVYPNLKTLLGIPFEGPNIVKEYGSRHPALDIVGVEGRPTIAFKSKAFPQDELPFSVEELLAMELQNIRDNAMALAGKGNVVSEVVFTIPSFYTADERRALEVAANLAGLKVLGMVSDGLAVGIQYATSRTFPTINEGGKPEYHMVFDMGAGSATATVLKFLGKTVKDVGRFNKTIQEVIVLGTGWDRTLGGDSLNGLIMDHMVEQLVESPSAKKIGATAADIKAHGRTAAKLLKEAEKIRQVLSANTDTGASFEGLYEEVDFRYQLSRSKFEELATNFAARVDGPIMQALATSGITFADLDSVILHGGTVRTPFVQKKLEILAGGAAKLRSNVNADEAAVFGAAFKAAGLSPNFRVKEIRDSDATGYAVGVQYMWNLKDRLQKLFNPTSPIGTVKDIPFKMTEDFEFTLYQSVPSGGEELINNPVVHVRTGNLTKVVSKLIDDESCERETFNTKFSVRLSPVNGLPEVLGGWVSCETEDKGKGGVMEDVKGFFGFGSKKGDQEPLKEGEASSRSLERDTSSSSDSSASFPPSTSSSPSSSVSTTDPESTEKAKTVKKKTVTSAVTFHVTQQGYEKYPQKELNRMKDRLAAFDASDKARRVREEVLNSLEAFTYRARDLLEDESFTLASTAEEQSKLENMLHATSEWIYSEGHDASEESLRGKLKEMKAIVDPIQMRKDEASKRPNAVKSLQEALEQTKSFTSLMKEQIEVAAEASSSAAQELSNSSASSTAAAKESATTSVDPLAELEEEDMLKSTSSETPEPSMPPQISIYDEADLKKITDTYESVQQWLEYKLTEQAKLSDSDDPVILVKDIETKSLQLNKVLMEIVQRKMQMPTKSKSPRPKATKKPKKAAKDKKKKKGEEKESGNGGGEEIRFEKETPPVSIRLEDGATEEEILEAVESAKKRIRDEL